MSASLMSRFAESFVGSTVVVTGGARGIGLATAQAFAAGGADVLLLDLDKVALDEAIATNPDRFSGVCVDLTDETAVEQVGQALAGAAPLKVWINNAGVVSHNTADDVTLEEYESVQHKNATTVLSGAKIARAHMGSFDDHSIVNISSLAAIKAMNRRISYGVSKTSVLAITRYLAFEWGTHGIRVNAICPGHIATRLTQFAEGTKDAEFHAELLARLPVSRRGTGDDIAGAALYLSSSLATYVTGNAIVVDGGWALS